MKSESGLRTECCPGKGPPNPAWEYKKSKRASWRRWCLNWEHPEYGILLSWSSPGSQSPQTVLPHAPDGMGGGTEEVLERKTVNSYLLKPQGWIMSLNLILTSLQHGFVDFLLHVRIEAQGGCLSHTTNKQQIKFKPRFPRSVFLMPSGTFWKEKGTSYWLAKDGRVDLPMHFLFFISTMQLIDHLQINQNP